MNNSPYNKFDTEEERKAYKRKQTECFCALSYKYPDWSRNWRLAASIKMANKWATKVRSKGFL